MSPFKSSERTILHENKQHNYQGQIPYICITRKKNNVENDIPTKKKF